MANDMEKGSQNEKLARLDERMAVYLNDQTKPLVGKFRQEYQRINNSQLCNVALEFYIREILEKGMDEKTWLPRQAIAPERKPTNLIRKKA